VGGGDRGFKLDFIFGNPNYIQFSKGNLEGNIIANSFSG
jgi:hypothetical protein